MKTIKTLIDTNYLNAIDMRIGLIVKAEPIEDADRLLKLRVKFNDEFLTVVSAIKKHFKPEDLVGQKMPFILNLKPRTIRGILSEAMIVMSEHTDQNEDDDTTDVFLNAITTTAPSDSVIF